MDKSYLTEAFKELDILNEETFSLTDIEAPEKLSKFADCMLDDPTIDIIDPEADTEEELKDSYIGKVIIDCEVCHSKIYKNAEDIHVSAEDSEVCNEDEECPYCYSVDGYKIVGQVAPYSETEIKVDVEDKEDSEEHEAPAEEEKKDELQEGLADRVRSALAKYKKHPVKEGHVCEQCGKEPCECEKEVVNESPADEDRILSAIDAKVAKNIEESIEKVDVETDNQIIHVSSEEKAEEGEEMIAPIKPEVKAEIDSEVDKEVEDDLGLDAKAEKDAEEVDYDFDEFDEDSFDGLGEAYLKEAYDNVDSFKTSSVSVKDNSLIVEGTIKFNSGKSKATKFIFEAAEATKNRKVRFDGLNEQISRGKKSFKLSGSLKDNKFISESLNYNYRAKDENGKTTRLYGTVKA